METNSTLELGLNTERAKRILEIAREVGALLTGEFMLTSGKKSNYYFDGKRLTLSPEGAYQVGKAVFDELAEIGVDAVGGVATGAYPIVTAVALVSHLEGKPIPSFIVREVPKEHGTMRKIEGHLKQGSRVAIVDDVLTTGGSVSRAIEAVEAANCKVVKVIVVVDRHEGGSDKLKKEGYDFTAILSIVH
ncbi:MAG: orotate phosphoribosyltransferase [Dehalococcoidia bacterium]|nr:MAG: orotate phosphoribosyltransferase [Dehalococcoidia bacterium]